MSIDHVKSRPKCYCTSTCPIPLDDLKSNCTSGQLLPDLCGTCLICAKSRGQKCGGLNNQLGVCGVGLRCLVRFQLKRGSHGIQEENNATGTCVSDTSDLCPGKYILQNKFSFVFQFFHFSGPEIEHLRDGINCRPGRLGIISEALYCKSESTGLKSSAQTTTPTSNTPIKITITPPDDAPSLIQILLDGLPRPFDKVPNPFD